MNYVAMADTYHPFSPYYNERRHGRIDEIELTESCDFCGKILPFEDVFLLSNVNTRRVEKMCRVCSVVDAKMNLEESTSININQH